MTKIENSQLNKLENVTKNDATAILRLSADMFGTNTETFFDKLPLTNTQLN